MHPDFALVYAAGHQAAIRRDVARSRRGAGLSRLARAAQQERRARRAGH